MITKSKVEHLQLVHEAIYSISIDFPLFHIQSHRHFTKKSIQLAMITAVIYRKTDKYVTNMCIKWEKPLQLSEVVYINMQLKIDTDTHA